MSKLTIKTTFNNGVEVYQDIKSKQFDVTKLFETANQNLGINKRVDNWLKSDSCKELFNLRVEKALQELLSQQPLNQENNSKLLKDSNFSAGNNYRQSESYKNYDKSIKEKCLCFLRENNIDSFKIQYKFSDSRFLYDLGSEELKLLVEFDGGGHEPKGDDKKNKIAENNGFLVLRLYSENEFGILLKLINKLKNGETITPKKLLKFTIIEHKKLDQTKNRSSKENEEVMKKLRKEAEKQVLKITKSKNTKEGWIKGSVMADPVMTLDAASYLDARLKNEVYEYYLDDKVKERTKVLEDYKKLCSAIVKYIGKDKTIFQNVVYKINGIVFDKFMGDLWNDGCTKEQYEELDKIFNNLITYMEDGIIDGLQSLLKTLDKWYIKKYGDNF